LKITSLLFCAVALVATKPVSAQTSANSIHASIERSLNESAAAWTAGDLKKFMQLYENSPTTRYINPEGVTMGYAAIQSSYAARFNKGGASMDPLTLELIDVKEVGPEYAFVVGRYHLQPKHGPAVSGVTTLLFHKVAEQWLIAVDHTS
jgi:ketosteroid isomerase-like protein